MAKKKVKIKSEEEVESEEIVKSEEIVESEEEKTARLQLESDWDSLEYQRNREAEYPTVAEMTVAMYDEDDMAALKAKRAAIKKKWPKDNSGPV